MMTKIKVLVILIGILYSCHSNSKHEKFDEVQLDKTETFTKKEELDPHIKNEEVFSQEDTLKNQTLLLQEFSDLYTELLVFKDKSDFHKYGFSIGGPYHEWYLNVQELNTGSDSKLLFAKGIVAGELLNLGIEYLNSLGRETDISNFRTDIFNRALSSEKIEPVETKSGAKNYAKIRNEYSLFGKWKIRNSFFKAEYGYEIYIKDSDFVGILIDNDYKVEKLEKKGDNYHIKGNFFGEYYKVNSEMELSLYDRDGSLTNAGYSTIKDLN